ncbi:MAG: AtpZ/AtpI family protein [Acidimicrobiales bacterium]
MPDERHGPVQRQSLAGKFASPLADRRDLNNGFGNALAKAFELALTPAIFAFFGWLLDRWLGTTPLFLVVLFLFTTGYTSWRMFSGYDAKMRAEEAKVLGRNPEPVVNSGARTPEVTTSSDRRGPQ